MRFGDVWAVAMIPWFIPRVVVDVEDGLTPQNDEALWQEIADKAEVQVGDDIWDYLIYDNVTEIVEDTEMPYDEEYDF